LARALRDLGRLAEARAIAAAVVELEARLGHPPARWGNASAILHAVELSLGDPRALQALRMDARSEPNPHYRLAVHQMIATWQARFAGARRATEVEGELAAARADAERAGCPRCAAEVSIVSAELLARIGRSLDAKRELAAWERRPVADYLQRQVWRLRARWAIAVAAGDHRAAGPPIKELTGILERAGMLDELAWARLDMGRTFSRTDRARAIEAFGAATVLAERIGATSISRLAAQELRRLGVRAWRRGPASDGAGLAALSHREREVARLVAAGETNRSIAEALLVSPKTVERHLTNILAKVGLRNRAELAAHVGSAAVRGSPDE
jgi:DNA-binding CsgD family transcriptional regulator